MLKINCMFKCFIEPVLLLQHKVHLPSKSYSYGRNSIKTGGWGSLWAFLNINPTAPVLTDHTGTLGGVRNLWDKMLPEAGMCWTKDRPSLDGCWGLHGWDLGRFGLCVNFGEVKYISKFDIYFKKCLWIPQTKKFLFPPLLTSLHEETQTHLQFTWHLLETSSLPMLQVF